MQEKSALRHKITLWIVFAYLLPILFLGGYSAFIAPSSQAWELLLYGWALVAIGTVLLMRKMWQWDQFHLEAIGSHLGKQMFFDEEEALVAGRAEMMDEDDVSTEAPDVDLSPSPFEKELEEEREKTRSLEMSLEEKIRCLEEEKQETYSLQEQMEQLRQEFSFYQETSRDQLNQKDALLSEYAQKISDLRSNMEKKQQKISKLKSTVNDLTYEVKTLVQLSDVEMTSPSPQEKNEPSEGKFVQASLFSPEPIPNREEKEPVKDRSKQESDAEAQLKRSINIAQKLTGASHFELSNRFPNFSGNRSTLDQRRLSDSLSSEEGFVVVFSLRENKLLFANQHTKEFLGWSPDRFMQDFPSLMQGGHSSWNQALGALREHQLTDAFVTFKMKSGSSQELSCRLGLIPTGLFKGHVVAVFYGGSD